LVNKAFEVAECGWLFDVGPTQIDVVVHPQSIVHSFVAFRDGVMFAQLSEPDMMGPISYGLMRVAKPTCRRLKQALPPMDFRRHSQLTFLPLDNERFPAVSLMKSCMNHGKGLPAVFNCANDCAVQQFLSRKISFDSIVPRIERAVNHFHHAQYSHVEDLFELFSEVESYCLSLSSSIT
jgi:1-deoxy-D-xylulose-5-phosphate reductoisomerase